MERFKLKNEVMADERTPLAQGAPSYIVSSEELPYSTPRNTKIKQFQCCICTSLLSAFVCALVIAICYSVANPNSFPLANFTNFEELNDTDFNSTGIDTSVLLALIDLPLEDEPEVPWNGPNVTQTAKDTAIKDGKIALGDKEVLEESLQPPPVLSPTFKHQKAVSTTLLARELSKSGYIEDHATRSLVKKFSKGQKRKSQKRWSIGRGPEISLDLTPSLNSSVCDFNARYRTANGTCNNKLNPNTFGVAFRPFRRAINPDYADGISAPRCDKNGKPLASARQVSLEIHRPSYQTDPHFTVMLAVWGQFLDHDITATALSQGQNGEPIECCDVKDTNKIHPECFPVPIDSEDPFFQQYNVTCMNFVRSAPAPTGHFGHREQLNQATAFIDGSVVYGSTEEKQLSLRAMQGGKLRMLVIDNNRELLPVSKDPNDGCNQDKENAKGRYCFDSGDTRSNENLHLTSMHLIWARHHNYIADNLAKLNPHWDDERIFQEARKILGAQMQHITYNEFLSVVLGKQSSEKFGILSQPSIETDTYNASVDPSIANHFASAAFRFAHTLLPRLFLITKDTTSPEGVAMHRMLFNPYSLYKKGGLDSAMDSAMNTPLEKADPYFNDELKGKLFQKPDDSMSSAKKALKPCGLDLVSLNIQRGRDHGLPSYPEFRKYCKLPSVDTWEEMSKAVDPASLRRMMDIYREPENVDAYTGGLSEPPMNGGILGPLFTCLIADQFVRLKQGDSFWYERKIGPQRFSRSQLNQIYSTLLSSVICRNSDQVTFTQRYVMKRSGRTNLLEDCRSLDTFDFTPWKEDQYSQGRGYYTVETSNDQSKVMVMQGTTNMSSVITEKESNTLPQTTATTFNNLTTTEIPSTTTVKSENTTILI
uniref:CSON015496 protein n=1 Tax=Culicoides sonorensis TaxID=179676 RepID=A0A336M1I8_CULSO